MGSFQRPRFRLGGWVIAALVLLMLSDRVSAERFGPAEPAVRAAQRAGGRLALAIEGALGGALGQLRGSGLPVSPEMVLGAGGALVLGLVRARARRERSRGNAAGAGGGR